MEKSTNLGHRKESGITDDFKCVGVVALVGGMQCWLVPGVFVCVFCVRELWEVFCIPDPFICPISVAHCCTFFYRKILTT